MTDIENKIETEEKLTEAELEQVAGGAEEHYFDPEIYEQYGIFTMDGGNTFLYGKNEITEKQAAAIAFYSIQLPPDMVKKARKKGFDSFLNTVTAYRLANITKFHQTCDELKNNTATK